MGGVNGQTAGRFRATGYVRGVPPVPPIRDSARTWLRSQVLAIVQESLGDPRPVGEHLRGVRGSASQWLARSEALCEAAGLLARSVETRTGPFVPDMTVDHAWRRHPGVRAVFTARHLPACDQCAVRHDETLQEVAAAYGFGLDALLRDLNSLLGGPDRDPSRASPV